MNSKLQCLLMAGLVGWSVSASADILELKNGTILNGKYVGGTAGTMRFETAAGVQVLGTSEVMALTFTGGGAAAPPVTPAAVPAAAPAANPAPMAPANITLPAGTMLLVRLLKRKFFKKFTRVIGAKKAARFFQIENQINTAIDLRISASLPLIK